MSLRIKKLFLIVVAFSSVINIYADWNSCIMNFKKELYGKGTQTWQITPYSNGNWVYFANKNGLIQFDGSEWKVFPLNNGQDVRAVYISKSKNRIYAAGINEFGYFEPNFRGELVYTCLSDLLRMPDRYPGNIWNVFENDNLFYWQADNEIIKITGSKYTIIPAGGKIDCCNLVNGALYIATSVGVKVLIGDSFFPISGDKVLNSKRIRGLMPYKRGLLIATAYDGLYYWDREKTVRYITGIEDFLSQNEVFTIVESKDKIAIGTVHKGLVIIDKKTYEPKFFNENNGLQNNTVLSLGFDALGNLWAGLDNGIDYILLNSPFTNLYSYPNSYGTGYAVALSDNKLYLGTNRGLYAMPYPVRMTDRAPLINIQHASGQVWNLAKIGMDLFCMHDRGFFLIKGLTIKKIGNVSGVWSCKMIPNHPDKLLLGTYDGICLVQKVHGRWIVKKYLNGIRDSAQNFEIDDAGIIWLHNDQRGVMRADFDFNTCVVKRVQYIGKKSGFPSNRNIYVNKVDNEIYFTSPAGIFKYNHDSHKIEPDIKMNKRMKGGAYIKLIKYKDSIIGFTDKVINIVNLDDQQTVTKRLSFSIEHSPIDLVHGFEQISPVNDSLIIIPNESGFALLNTSFDIKKRAYTGIHIKYVSLSYPKEKLIYCDNYLRKKYVPKISFKHNSIRFEYGLFSINPSKEVKFRYRMDNQNEWSDCTSALTKEYSDLHEGEYTFQVQAVYDDGSTSSDSFSFIILPPWYRSSGAYFCYFVMLFFFLWGVHKWDQVRVKRKKREIIIKKDQELLLKEKEYQEENAKKERQIVELEKEKLEYELKHKSQEMANLMINFMRKNEILTDIKQELFKIISKLNGLESSPIKKMLLLVNNKIDLNMKSDDMLKHIEEQFDLVHNNFMKKLNEKYPDLSLSEKMMCAYIKMDLSTKEIAPLLNLSIRGVETIRYRLRKKFSLDRDDSLSDYLNTKI